MGAHFELLVEEPSMEAFLTEAMPRILPDESTFAVRSFRGKRQLLDKLEVRLRAYAKGLPAVCKVVVLVDRDREECRELKRRIEGMAARAGLLTRARAGGGDWQAATRIVCEELEAWYFGDWEAVKSAYPKARSVLPRKLRSSDAIAGGTWEELERVLQQAGYFRGGLRKIEAARAIAKHIDPNRNASPSFRVFRDAVIEAASSA